MTAGADLDHNGRGDVVAVVDDRWAQLWWANQPHALLEDTPRGGTALRVVRPRAAETWVAGSARFVEWRLALPPGAAVPTVDAAVWCDGAPTGTAVANLPGGGIAQLVVAPASPPSSDCRLRLWLPSLPGVVAESASFTVVPGPWVFGDGFETGGLGAWGGTAPVAVRLPLERW